MNVFFGILVAIAGTCWWFYRQRKKAYEFFKSRGINTPPPNIIDGNAQEAFQNGYEKIAEWHKKFAVDRHFGFYLGPQPILVSSDLEFAQRVLIKEFSSFINRGSLLPLEKIHPIVKKMIVVQEDMDWKSTRSYITSCFSASKLRAYLPSIEQGCQDLNRFLDKQCEKSTAFDMYYVYKCLTLDSISRIGYGIQSNTLDHPEQISPIMKSALECLDASTKTKMNHLARTALFLNAFPIIRLILKYITHTLHRFNLSAHPFDKMLRYTRELIAYRKKNHIESNDFINAMLKAEAYTTNNFDELTMSEDAKEEPLHCKGVMMPQMDADGVVGNSTIFFLGGFETTSTALGYLTNHLADNLDIQERLRKEIFKTLEEHDGKITYDSVMSCCYLSQVIDETLRMNPPIINITARSAMKAFEYKGRQYPAGMTVLFPTHVIHHDPEYFPDPERFDPDRFSPKRKPQIPSGAFMPFGIGPRNCIGMRFSLNTVKIVTCHLMTKFRFLPTDENWKVLSHGMFINRPNSTKVRVEKIG